MTCPYGKLNVGTLKLSKSNALSCVYAILICLRVVASHKCCKVIYYKFALKL